MDTLAFLESEAPARARPVRYNGRVALEIDGRPHWPMFMMSPWGEGEHTPRGRRRVAAAARAGVHLHITQQFLDLAAHTAMWRGDGDYDFDGMDDNLRAIVESDPQAHILVKLYVQPPLWWMKAHPSEAMRYADGYEAGGDHVFCGAEDGQFPSVASTAWRRDAAAMLRAFIAHLDAVPWGKRVIGINLLNGVCQEWHYWGSVHDHLPDASPPMQAAFRRWLARAYGSDEALRAAWGDPAVTLATAVVPSSAARDTASFGYFRHPVRDAPAIDYYRCQHDQTAEAIEYFADTVKEASGGRLLAGAYYGYVFTCPWYTDGLSAAVSRVLARPAVDFLASPAAYEDYLSRGVGGDSLLRGLPESCRLHGKLYLSESDEGAYLCPQTYHECERMADFEESAANYYKAFARLLTSGAGNWWFDLDDESGLFLHEPHHRALAAMQRIADGALRQAHEPADIALVIGVESLLYTDHTAGDATYKLLDTAAHVLSRAGVSFDIITDRELPLCGNHKLYIFSCLYHADNDQITAIRAKLEREGAVAVWLYAAGLFGSGPADFPGNAAERMTRLTGIALRLAESPIALCVALDEAAVNRLAPARFAGTVKHIDVPAKREEYARRFGDKESPFTGTGDRLSPAVWAEDAGAIPLGTLPDGQCGLCVKRNGRVTDVFCAAALTSTELARWLARLAGAHVFTDDGVLMASGRYLALPVRDSAGEKTIRLPGRSRVTDLLTGEEICRDADRFTVMTRARATYLFQIDNQED